MAENWRKSGFIHTFGFAIGINKKRLISRFAATAGVRVQDISPDGGSDIGQAIRCGSELKTDSTIYKNAIRFHSPHTSPLSSFCSFIYICVLILLITSLSLDLFLFLRSFRPLFFFLHSPTNLRSIAELLVNSSSHFFKISSANTSMACECNKLL